MSTHRMVFESLSQASITSLVPRPSLALVFGRLQYCRTGTDLKLKWCCLSYLSTNRSLEYSTAGRFIRDRARLL